MRAIMTLAVAAILLLAACAPAATTAPTVAPSAPSSIAPAGPAGTQSAIVLHASSPGGCDAIGVEYHSVTFHFDAEAVEQVWAVTDTNALLRTGWSPEFRPDPTGKAILDPAGQVVVSDGEQLVLPASGWPRLHGYFVCLGPESVLVWFTDPE